MWCSVNVGGLGYLSCSISQQFEVEIRNRFSVLDEDDLNNWDTLRDSVQEVTKVLWVKTNSKQDWISDSTRDLIDKKREARFTGQTSA